MSWEPVSLTAHSGWSALISTVCSDLGILYQNLWKLGIQLFLLFLTFCLHNCFVFLDKHTCYMDNIKISQTPMVFVSNSSEEKVLKKMPTCILSQRHIESEIAPNSDFYCYFYSRSV